MAGTFATNKFSKTSYVISEVLVLLVEKNTFNSQLKSTIINHVFVASNNFLFQVWVDIIDIIIAT